MSCGYACINCGACKGIARPVTPAGLCPACKTQNDEDASTCSHCGMPLPPRPGKLKGER